MAKQGCILNMKAARKYALQCGAESHPGQFSRVSAERREDHQGLILPTRRQMRGEIHDEANE